MQIKTVVLLIISALFYSYLVQSLPTFGFERWQAIALFNLGLIAVLWMCVRPGPLRPQGNATLQKIAWATPLIVLSIVLGIFFLSPSEVGDQRYSLMDLAMLCLVIPIVEEVLFRSFITRWINTKLDSPALVLLTSATVFALAHASLPDLVVPIGPYLLGLVTAAIYLCTGNVLSSILLHAVCNASAILFAYYSPVWLERLNFLYLKL